LVSSRALILPLLLTLLLISFTSSVEGQREGMGVGEEVSFLTLGVDGCFVEGNASYFRPGDYVSVRGAVGASSGGVVGAPVALRILDPSGRVWYEGLGSVERGVEGLREFTDAAGVHRSPWRAECGFQFLKVKRVGEGDLEGKYVVQVSIDDLASGSTAFYVKSAPRAEEPRPEAPRVEAPPAATVVAVAAGAAAASAVGLSLALRGRRALP